jgi:ABC-type dipeptide/oligopeptide/nickel transport system permease subunit
MRLRALPLPVVLAAAITALAIIFALLGGPLFRFHPNDIDVHWMGFPLPPCFLDAKACVGHALGTDDIGRDILARLFFGGRATLGLSLIAVSLELAIGIFLGLLSRYGGAVLRFVVERISDALSSFPVWPLLVIVIVLWTPQAIAGLTVAAALISPPVTRLTAAAHDLRGAARALADQAARDFTKMMFLLATIDFFGVGIQPPTASWGNMLEDPSMEILTAWWALVFPALCLVGTALIVEVARRRLKVLCPARDSNSEPPG